MAIKPGDLDRPSDADRDAAFDQRFRGSMAEEIEIELNRLLTQDGLPALPDDDSEETRGRRRLIIAIARGVVRHIVENRTAIEVEVPPHDPVSPTFDTEGL